MPVLFKKENELRDRLLPFSSELGFTRLFREFMGNPRAIRRDFELNDCQTAINEISAYAYNRSAITDILSRQNKAWGASRETLANIEKLGDKTSVIVSVGQQACLFGGPYLVILKALAAVKRAAEIEKEYNIPAVPLFWIAADDHDMPEISFADVFDMQSRLLRLEIKSPEDTKAPPVGTQSYSESIERARNELYEHLPDNDFRSFISTLLDDAYKSGRNITDAFARLMTKLLGHLGLVVFTPYDEEFKRHVSEVMRDIISRHDAVKQAVADANELLDKSGYHQQVVKADTAAHLFAHLPNREPVHCEGERYTAGDRTYSRNELLAAIHDTPLDFSPDVLTRPIVQSAFFPVASFIGGPAEVAYFLQLEKLYAVFGIPQPELRGRPSATLIETRFEKLMDDENISLNDLAGRGEQIIAEAVVDTFPDDIENEFKKIRENTASNMQTIEHLAGRIDKTLIDAAAKTKKNIDKEFGELHKRLINAHKKQNKLTRRRFERLYENLYPRRQPAERAISIVYFLSRYGDGIVDFIDAHLTLDAKGHQLLMLSEYDG